jgi:hypothetical protein
MTRMTSTVTDDSGPVPGVYVYAELQGSAWLAGHTGEVETEIRAWTDPTGRWVLDLTPNELLEQPDSWWLVRIFQRGSVGLNVPLPPFGDGLVDISTPGVLRDVGPPPNQLDEYVRVDQLGVPDGVATLGTDGILTLAQRPPQTAQGFQHTQSQPVALVQVIHGFSFKPAGVVCLEPDGTEIEYSTITHPLPGVTELLFGVPFTGTVYVS